MSFVGNAAKGLALAYTEAHKTVPPRRLTQDEVTRGVLEGLDATINECRAEPWDRRDALDRGGAAAATYAGMRIFKDPPRDDAADLHARASVLDYLIRNVLAAANEGAVLTTEEGTEAESRQVHDIAHRVSHILFTLAAWTRDGMPTYDVSSGLYDVLRNAISDPGVGAMPFRSVKFARPAFAVRLPGPRYPVIRDGRDEIEVRAVIAWCYADCATTEQWGRMRDAMVEASNDAAAHAVVGAEHPDTPRNSETARVMSLAGRSVLTDTSPAISILLCCYLPSENRMLSHVECPHLLMRVQGVPLSEEITVARAIAGAVDGIQKNIGPTESAEPWTSALMVALGAGLYVGNVEEGQPVRSKSLRTKLGPITPDTRVLGRGVKTITQREGGVA